MADAGPIVQNQIALIEASLIQRIKDKLIRVIRSSRQVDRKRVNLQVLMALQTLIAQKCLDGINEANITYPLTRYYLTTWIGFIKLYIQQQPYKASNVYRTGESLFEAVGLLCCSLEGISQVKATAFTVYENIRLEADQLQPLIPREMERFVPRINDITYVRTLSATTTSCVFRVQIRQGDFTLKYQKKPLTLYYLNVLNAIEASLPESTAINLGGRYITEVLNVPTQPNFPDNAEIKAACTSQHQLLLRHFAWYPALTSRSTQITIMEYCEGIDLQTVFSRSFWRFLPDEVRHITAQVLLALEHLHYSGFIHTNINPASILITPQLQVKLSGFENCIQCMPHLLRRQNLPQYFTNTSHEVELRTCPRPLGHTIIAYQSPEYRTGNRPLGRSTDFWSIGVLICKMATGKLPFVMPSSNPTSFLTNVRIPTTLDENTGLFLKGLLEEKPIDRLGSYEYVDPVTNEIHGSDCYTKLKKHAFFTNINFNNFARPENALIRTIMETKIDRLQQSGANRFAEIGDHPGDSSSYLTYVSNDFIKFFSNPHRTNYEIPIKHVSNVDTPITCVDFSQTKIKHVLNYEFGTKRTDFTVDVVIGEKQEAGIERENVQDDEGNEFYLVTNLAENGPAMQAGLLVGDIYRKHPSKTLAKIKNVIKKVPSFFQSIRPSTSRTSQDSSTHKDAPSEIAEQLPTTSSGELGTTSGATDRPVSPEPYRISALLLNPVRIINNYNNFYTLLGVNAYHLNTRRLPQKKYGFTVEVRRYRLENALNVCLVQHVSKRIDLQPSGSRLYAGDIILNVEEQDICGDMDPDDVLLLLENKKQPFLNFSVAPVSALRTRSPLLPEHSNFIEDS